MLSHHNKLATLKGFTTPRRKVILGFLGAAMTGAIFAVSGSVTAMAQINDQEVHMNKPQVTLHTNQGDIVLELDAEKAPNTVENFLSYVQDGFYDGTIFHRVIDGFMIQGGGFEPGLKHKPTKDPIENEADNGLKNDRYTIAMARTNDPHSATAQFFINVADNDFLNFTAPTPTGWGYAVFGQVIEGTEVVDAIKGVKTGSMGMHQDVPVEDIVIEKATITAQ